jgi:hypothetical protein
MQGYDVLVQEVDSQLKFFSRGYEETVDIDPDDLVAAQSGDKPGDRPFTLYDPSGFLIPRQVNVTYIDPSVDYQPGSMSFQRNAPDTSGIKSFNLPLVIRPNDAGDFAAQQLWRAHSERMQMEFSLPPSYITLRENDIASIPWEGETYNVRITEINRGNNWLLNFKGVLVGVEDSDEEVDCGERENEITEMAIPDPVQSPILVSMLDLPAVRDSEVEQPGIYLGTVLSPLQTNQDSASIYSSSDGVNWLLMSSTLVNSNMGITTSVLATGVAGFYDLINTVTVYMYKGELTSVTEAELLTGSNRMWICKELIGFQTATLIAPNTYTLSMLMRGLRVTPTTHVLNERVVVAIPDLVKFEPLSLSIVGQRRYFKVLQAGQELEDVPTHSFNFTGATLKQLPPCQVVATHSLSTGDITVTWTRRTRSLVRTFTAHKPLNADVEKYEIEFWFVYLGQPNQLIRTKSVTGATTVSYPWSERGSDLPATGMSTQIWIKIFQINEAVGRGYPAELLSY